MVSDASSASGQVRAGSCPVGARCGGGCPVRRWVQPLRREEGAESLQRWEGETETERRQF